MRARLIAMGRGAHEFSEDDVDVRILAERLARLHTRGARYRSVALSPYLESLLQTSVGGRP